MSKSLLTQYAELFDLDTGIFRFGEKFFPLRHIINAQKGGTFFVMFALMCYYNNFSLGAWVYLGLHGSYGKNYIFKNQESYGLLRTIPSLIKPSSKKPIS